MKVAHLIPSYPPYPNGITDYAFKLAQQLFNNHQISSYFIFSPDLTEFIVQPQFDFFEFAVLADYAPDTFLKQLPLEIDRLIIHFGFYVCPLLKALTGAKTARSLKIIIMFHELVVPPSLKKPVRDTLKLFLPSRTPNPYQGRVEAVKLANAIFTNTSQFKGMLSRWTSQPIRVIPNFSSSGEPDSILPLRERKRRMVIFGSKGTKARIYNHNLEQILLICQTFKLEEIHDIGFSTPFDASRLGTVEIVQWGIQSPEQISQILSESLIGFFNYSHCPGLLGKSSIFAAYSAHSLLIISGDYNPSEADGVNRNSHYIVCDENLQQWTLDQLQTIANNAHRWYHTHSLTSCAQEFATALEPDADLVIPLFSDQFNANDTQIQRSQTPKPAQAPKPAQTLQPLDLRLGLQNPVEFLHQVVLLLRTKTVLRSSLWTILGYGSGQSLRFISNLILAHLLMPETFGLMAIVNALIIGLELISDLGIGQSVIQNPQGDNPDFYNTAWTLKLLRGFGIWLLCLAITQPIARFYEEPRLLWLIPIVGLASVINGFRSSALFTLNRQMNLKRLMIYQLAVQIVATTIGITWAEIDPNIRALAAGAIGGEIFGLIYSHRLLAEVSNRFCWHQESLKELVLFGKWMFASSGTFFVAEQADRFILGKLVSLDLLGIYSIASTFAMMPRQIIMQIGSRVIFPQNSKYIDYPRPQLRAIIRRQRWFILIGTGLILSVLTSWGDLIVTYLYDDRYAPASWMLPLLSLGVWFSALFHTANSTLLSLGKPLYLAQSNTARLVVIVFGIPFAFSVFGVVGAISVVATSDVFSYFTLQYGLLREQLSCLEQDLKATGFLLTLLSLMMLIRLSLGLGLPIHAIL